MNGSVTHRLIWADWNRHRVFILGSIVAGATAFTLMQFGSEVPFVFGVVLLFTSLIVLGCMLPVSTVINERKKQTLPFLMSLPISIMQFTTAKLVATFGMFLVPWITLVGAGFFFIVSRADLPDGLFPFFLILAMLPFVGFALIAGTAFVSESEGLTIAATIGTNTTYGLGWYMLVRDKTMRDGMKSPTIVWGSDVLRILGFELGIIAVILAITFYLQSRKRDFV